MWIHPINLSESEETEWAGAVGQLFVDLSAAGMAAVPVVTLEEPPAMYAAVREVISVDGRGMVLRLDCEQVLEEDPAALQPSIDHVLSECGVDVAAVDLVVDCGLAAGGIALQSGAAGSALAALPHIGNWRNLTVAFSGFPEKVGDQVPASSVGAVPRTDAAAFRHLLSRWSGRLLLFGDYGVGVPTYSDAPWSPIPNIRYAVGGEWMIHRAGTKTNPSPQYRKLAEDLVAAPYFDGPGFSPGDAYISDVASGADGPGNAESYLKAAMSRHFHVVLDSLATHGAP